MIFKKFENHLDFVCQPASQPAVRPGSARYTAPENQHSKGYPVAFTKLVPKTIYPLRHGDSFILPFFTFFSIDWNA